MKNPHFLADQAETLSILPTHEIVIFTKFHTNWTKIVDFSLIAYFSASAIFYYSVFIILDFSNINHFFIAFRGQKLPTLKELLQNVMWKW